jgi:hypothetical protein
LRFGSTWRREREKKKKEKIRTVIKLIGDGCWLAKRWRRGGESGESLVPATE